LTDFEKKSQLSNFMKIRPVGAESFHAGGRAGRQVSKQADGRAGRQAEAICRFAQFCERA